MSVIKGMPHYMLADCSVPMDVLWVDYFDTEENLFFSVHKFETWDNDILGAWKSDWI